MARTRGGLKRFNSKTRIVPEDHVTAQYHVVAEDHVAAQYHVAAEDHVPPQERVAAQERVVVQEHVAAEDHVVAEDHVAAQELVVVQEHVAAQDHVIAEDHVASQDHVVAEDHIGEPDSTQHIKTVPPSNDSFLAHTKFSSPPSTPETEAMDVAGNKKDFGETPPSPFLFLSPSPMGSTSSLSSLSSTPMDSDKALLLDTNEDKREFHPISSSSLSSHILSLIRKSPVTTSSADLKSAPRRSRDPDFTDETIPDPKMWRSQVSCMQKANNKAKTTIVISDDDEVVTPISTEREGNCTEFKSLPTGREVSTYNSNYMTRNLLQDHA